MNPSKVPLDEFKIHEEALLHLIDIARDKGENLWLEDQKKVFNEICEEIGFEQALEDKVLG